MQQVYTAISAVSAELAKEGISKSRKNDQQGYKFRGIDEVFNALAPALVEAKLLILPRMLTRQVVERATKNKSEELNRLLDEIERKRGEFFQIVKDTDQAVEAKKLADQAHADSKAALDAVLGQIAALPGRR